METAFLSEFRDAATAEQSAMFDATVAGPAVDQVAAWRKVLRTLPETRDGTGVDGSIWFNQATERLNLIRPCR